MAIALILKHSLTREILKIDERAEYITKLKDEAVTALLAQKQNISQHSKIDREKEYLEKDFGEFFKDFNEIRETIHERKKSYDELETEITQIANELDFLQKRHDVALQQLGEKRAFLEERLAAINQLDWRIEQTQQALVENEAVFKNEMDLMREKREKLMAETDLPPWEVEQNLALLDAEMENLAKEHAKISAELENKITELEGTASLNKQLLEAQIDELNNRKNELEARRLNASPSELIEIERELREIQEQMENLERLLGLAEVAQQEIRDLNQTPSGHFVTPSGHRISLTASQLGEVVDETVISRTTVGKLGASKFTGSSKSETISTVTASSRSGILSADSHYLKTVLGVPLTLALAEITAKQPRDPIHYLGHWLFKYRYNQEIDEVKKRELRELLDERERLRLAVMRQQADEEAKATLMDLLGRVNIEFERRAIEAELKRIQEEAEALEAANEQLEMEAQDTLGEYTGPTKGQKL